jgi:hypothetical protein
MSRKKWTQKTDIDDTGLSSREKKKWQIALRRYVIEEKPSPAYASYFGLDIKSFQSWLSLQLPSTTSFHEFGEKWQLTHVVPINYFNLVEEEEKKLCWNFLNILASPLHNDDESGSWIGFHRAKAYFSLIHKETNLPTAGKMVQKLSLLETVIPSFPTDYIGFLQTNKNHILQITAFSPLELELLNNGRTLEQINSEMNLLKKFQ